MKTRVMLLTLALFLVAAGAASADGSVGLRRWVLGNGASDAVSGEITLQATLGRPGAGVISGGDVSLGQGFWHGGELPTGRHSVYLPLVLLKR